MRIVSSILPALGVLCIASGCVSQKASSVESKQIAASLSEEESEALAAWHDYNDRQLTDLSLIVMPGPDVKRDAEGRPEVETNGSFGASRILPLGHMLRSPFSGNPTEEKRRNRALQLFDQKTAGVVMMFGAKMRPLTEDSINQGFWSDTVNTNHFRGVVANAEKAPALSLAKETLKTGQMQTGSTKLFRYQTRVIYLTDKACLNCHVGSKIGDPVAVMVYGLGEPTAILDEHNRLMRPLRERPRAR